LLLLCFLIMSNLLDSRDCTPLQKETGNLVLPESVCRALLPHGSSALCKSTAKDAYAIHHGHDTQVDG